MSAELKDKLKKINERFNDLTNFIELEDFRSYLLFTLTAQVPSNILAQMGLSGSKDTINLPYNPLAKIYYHKISLLSSSLTLYVKKDPLTDKFILKKDDALFEEYLNPNERKMAFRGKEKFIFPKISECSSVDLDGNGPKLTIKVDDLFHSLESLIAVTEPNVLFVLDGEDADLIFVFNMMPEFPTKLNKKVLKIDVYLDDEHETKGKTYLKREEDFKLTYISDIQEISHSELYKSSYSLILHIKSFDNPY